MKLVKRIDKGSYSDKTIGITVAEHDENLRKIEDAINFFEATSGNYSLNSLAAVTAKWTELDAAGNTPEDGREAIYRSDLGELWKWNSTLTDKAEKSRDWDIEAQISDKVDNIQLQSKLTELTKTKYEIVGVSFNSETGGLINNNATYRGFAMPSNSLTKYEASYQSDYTISGIGCYSGEPSEENYLGLALKTKTEFKTEFTTLENTTNVIFGVDVSNFNISYLNVVVINTESTKQIDFLKYQTDVDVEFKSQYKTLLTVQEKGFNSNTGAVLNGNSTYKGAWFVGGAKETTIEGIVTNYAGVGCYSSLDAGEETYLGFVNIVDGKFTPIINSVYCCVSVLGTEDYTELAVYNKEKRLTLYTELLQEGVNRAKYYRTKLEVIKKSFNTSTGALINNNSTYRGMETTADSLRTYVISSKEPWHVVFGVGCYSGEPSTDTYLGLVSLRSVGKEVEFTTLENTTNIIIGVLGTYAYGDIYIYDKENYLVNVNDTFRTSEFEVNSLKERCNQLELRNDFAWKDFDKGYVSFVIDDGNNDVGTLADVFIDKNTPVCLALPKERIRSEVTSSTAGTDVLSIAKSVVANGGEILAHAYTVITSANSFDFATMYETFALSKKALEENGFAVNGIITAGGADWNTADFDECVKWARMYYKYSDLFGYNTNVIQYNNPRSSMKDKTLAQLKAEIDDAISNNEWLVFFTHGSADGLDLTILADLLDYVNTKITATTLSAVNYRELYNQFKSSALEQSILKIN